MRPVLFAEGLDFDRRVIDDTLGDQADLVGERPQGVETIDECRVVTFDRHQLRHVDPRGEGDLVEVGDNSTRICVLIRGIVRHRNRDNVGLFAEVNLRHLGDMAGELLEDLVVGACLPRRVNRGVEGVNVGVHVSR